MCMCAPRVACNWNTSSISAFFGRGHHLGQRRAHGDCPPRPRRPCGGGRAASRAEGDGDAADRSGAARGRRSTSRRPDIERERPLVFRRALGARSPARHWVRNAGTGRAPGSRTTRSRSYRCVRRSRPLKTRASPLAAAGAQHTDLSCWRCARPAADAVFAGRGAGARSTNEPRRSSLPRIPAPRHHRRAVGPEAALSRLSRPLHLSLAPLPELPRRSDGAHGRARRCGLRRRLCRATIRERRVRLRSGDGGACAAAHRLY